MTVVLPLAPWTACTRSLTPQATASSAVRPAGAVGPRAAVIPTASVRNRVAVRPGCAATMAQKKKAEKSAKKLKAAARKRSRRAEECRGSLASWHADFLARTAEHLGCTPSSQRSGAAAGEGAAADAAQECSREGGEGEALWGEGPPLVEFHSHSVFSDGTLSPTDLVHRAAQRQVRVLALTDHDTFGGVEEAQRAGLEAGVAIVPGVEISTFLASDGGTQGSKSKSIRATGLHLLAYFPERPSADGGPRGELLRCLEGIRKGRIQRVKDIVARCRKKGVQIAPEDVFEAMGPSESASRNHVAAVLVERKAAVHVRDAFARFLADDMIPHGSGAEVDVREAIRLVLAAGGVPVLAHPWSAQGQGTRSLLRTLQEMGLQGVEVFRGTRKMEDFAFVAKELGLLLLGGSDYHARGAPGETELGECPVPLPEAMKLLRSLSTLDAEIGEDEVEEP